MISYCTYININIDFLFLNYILVLIITELATIEKGEEVEFTSEDKGEGDV